MIQTTRGMVLFSGKGGLEMSKLSVLTWKEGDVYVADCPTVRIASQGNTEEEALSALKEAIELFYEDSETPNFPDCERAHAREIEVTLAS